MQIKMAHLRERSTTGAWVNFAVFSASSAVGNNDAALAHLTAQARRLGLQVDQAALAFSSAGRVRFYGTKNLVNYLSKRGVPRWTHTIDI
ncbi:hypothetical protein EAT51_12440 [Pseudoxanthomonas winnipegensis]|uniref:Uncharacterized protein n=1 Tax=Pseudoxanthomonas winnipegensis TaxID=2480810 RepID=A0A4Q8LBK9_9GAMM|nr:hypothetical protein EA662_14780 [Pseudoxanthomonas winnipegensis]TAA26115.1 hypothetical protein EA661_16375 [Pseudoxanthomonas winnipegensis]TAA39819.1 hypothetical protein EAT51_12440 [Pseudoxanthomonas winnipegensis]TBV72965.1 hypothetical protein EYC46_15700 [Pseudoxanthomonas winnipegensis]